MTVLQAHCVRCNVSWLPNFDPDPCTCTVEQSYVTHIVKLLDEPRKVPNE